MRRPAAVPRWAGGLCSRGRRTRWPSSFPREADMAIDPHLKVGESSSFSKTIAESDLMLFAGISGDFDPIHVNEEFAKTTAFGRRIAHGALVMSLCSTTASEIARRSQERGAKAVPVSLGYDKVRFVKPVFIGDTLTARYTV